MMRVVDPMRVRLEEWRKKKAARTMPGRPKLYTSSSKFRSDLYGNHIRARSTDLGSVRKNLHLGRVDDSSVSSAKPIDEPIKIMSEKKKSISFHIDGPKASHRNTPSLASKRTPGLSREEVQEWVNARSKPVEYYAKHIKCCLGHDPKAFVKSVNQKKNCFNSSKASRAIKPRKSESLKVEKLPKTKACDQTMQPIHHEHLNVLKAIDENIQCATPRRKSKTPKLVKSASVSPETKVLGNSQSPKGLKLSLRESNVIKSVKFQTPSSVIKFCVQHETPLTMSTLNRRFSALKSSPAKKTPRKPPTSQKRMSVVTPVRRSIRLEESSSKLPKCLLDSDLAEIFDDIENIPSSYKENMVFRSNEVLKTFSEYLDSP